MQDERMIRISLLACALAALVTTTGCSDRVSTTDAASVMDASAGDDGGTDAASTPDAVVVADANDHDAGSDASATPDVGTDAGPLDCTSLPECEAGKGCGPMLSDPCCCGGTLFDPHEGSCCCGYGIVPGNHLHCS
jgi:hypothetical protein